MEPHTHTQQFHDNCLQKLCRVCGGRNQSKKGKEARRGLKKCTDFATDILLVFDVSISADQPAKHPVNICTKCVDKIRNLKRKSSESVLAAARQSATEIDKIWTDFDATINVRDCQVCFRFLESCLGSRNRKRKAPNEEPSTFTTSTIEEETRPSAEETEPSTSYETGSAFGTDDDDLLLSHMDQLDSNVVLSEADRTIVVQEPSVSPPATPVSLDEPSSSTQYEMRNPPFASSTPAKQTLKTFKDINTSPIFKADKLFAESLSKPRTQPLSKEEEILTTHNVRRKTDPTGLLVLKTGGQPLIYHRIAKPRKYTPEVGRSAKGKRNQCIGSVRELMAGTSHEAVITQQALELKMVPSKTRRKICESAGIKQKAYMNTLSVMAMKEATNITNTQLRILRRFLKQSGVQMACEQEGRSLVKDLTVDNVVTQMVEFKGDLGETLVAPLGMINDIEGFITRQLDKLRENNLLTWHNNRIPDNEIWLKFGGDHGKQSLKFTMQIANTERPNSKTNTFLIAVAKVKDTHTNLQICLSHLKDKIQNLSTVEWEGKKIVLFIFGDYDFLTKVFGLSGAQGTYPCLWCLVPKSKLISGASNYLPRTLNSLKRDYGRFQKYSHGQKKNVGMYNNCLHMPLLDVSLNKVAPPYLHIMLGIVLKHHRLLEGAADEIDRKLSTQSEEVDKGVASSLREFGKNWRKAEDLKEQIDTLKSYVILSTEGTEEHTKFQDDLSTAEDSLDDLKKETLSPRSGPVCSALDQILDNHKIVPQSYHSRSFIGNHCNKYLTSKVYKHLTTSIVETTQANTTDKRIIDTAIDIREKFNKLNQLYEEVHTKIAHSRPIAHGDIHTINTSIENYMTQYRTQFQKKIIPKQHILEKHVVPWIEQYGFGMGLHGEQGGELIHSTVSKLEKRVCGLRNEEQQIKTLLLLHMLQTSPDLVGAVPPPKKRRKKDTS